MFHVPRVIEHYDDLSENTPEDIDSKQNECFICLEIHTNDNDTPIDWKTQKIYIRFCECGGWVHVQCVNRWYNGNNKCPICRQNMYTFDSTIFSLFLYVNNNNLLNIYVCIYECLRICKLMLWLFMATFYSFCIYSMLFTTPFRHSIILHNDPYNDDYVNYENYEQDNNNYEQFSLESNDPEL